MDAPATSSASTSSQPPLDHSTVDGAEALLAQTEMSDDFFNATVPNANSSSSPPATGLYSLLDDLINTAPVNSPSMASAKQTDMLGETDPRSNIIKSGIVSMADANVLVDQ